LAVGRVGAATELVTQHFVKCEDSEKLDVLVDVIKQNPGLTLIFVEQKKTAEMVDRFLQRKGFPSTSIHGDRMQHERTAALKAYSTGETPYLVATNVAARGLDIDNVAHVINYDMAKDVDDYVHRIGRTGRAGKKGTSTTLITTADSGVLPKLLTILDEAGVEAPSWMVKLKYDRPRKPGRGAKFGGTDYRRGGYSGGRGGYSGGRGGYSGGHGGYSGGQGDYSGGSGGYSGAGGYNNVPPTAQQTQAAPWNNQSYGAYQSWAAYGAAAPSYGAAAPSYNNYATTTPQASAYSNYSSYAAYPAPPKQ